MPSQSNCNFRPTLASGDALFALKGEARQLRKDAHARGDVVSHVAALELLAHSKGFRNWNALRAHAMRTDAGADVGASTGLMKSTGAALAARRREVMDGLNAGFMMAAERFVDAFARDGWALIESLEAVLTRSAEPDLFAASELLLSELRHQDVLAALKSREEALGNAFRVLSDAASHHELNRLELESARQRWDIDAAEFREVLRRAGSWVESCGRTVSSSPSGLRLRPCVPLLPSSVVVSLMSLRSPEAYSGRASFEECVQVIMETLSNELMSGRGPRDVKLSELMGALDKLDRQHTVWQEASTKHTSAKKSWVTAESVYVAQRQELVSTLDRLSESSKWELLCLVFPESVKRAKTPNLGRYDYR